MWSRWPTWAQVIVVVLALGVLAFAGMAIRDSVIASAEAEADAAQATAAAEAEAAEEGTKTSRWGAIGKVAGAVAGIIALCLV